MTRPAELITWCRIFAVGPACTKPCTDCRRTSAINARLPDDIRVSLTAETDQVPNRKAQP